MTVILNFCYYSLIFIPSFHVNINVLVLIHPIGTLTAATHNTTHNKTALIGKRHKESRCNLLWLNNSCAHHLCPVKMHMMLAESPLDVCKLSAPLHKKKKKIAKKKKKSQKE